MLNFYLQVYHTPCELVKRPLLFLDISFEPYYNRIVRFRTVWGENMEERKTDGCDSVLATYNERMKRLDDAYRDVSKQFGLSPCAFWILYTLRVGTDFFTQTDVCEFLHEPKQTVNSAIKKLEADGFLSLSAETNLRRKQIRLTERGKKLAKKTVDLVASAEITALRCLSEQEQDAFFDMLEKLENSLREQFQKINDRPEV